MTKPLPEPAGAYRWRFDCSTCRAWILVVDQPEREGAQAKATEWGWSFGESVQCSKCTTETTKRAAP